MGRIVTSKAQEIDEKDEFPWQVRKDFTKFFDSAVRRSKKMLVFGHER